MLYYQVYFLRLCVIYPMLLMIHLNGLYLMVILILCGLNLLILLWMITRYKWTIVHCTPLYLVNLYFSTQQVLTLASNERVPLTPSMRLIFEIGHLKTATPATVSRAGILFLNYADVGWNPYVFFLLYVFLPVYFVPDILTQCL